MRTMLSEEAKRRMESVEGTGLLRSDWVSAVFIHYRVDAEALRPFVPFELDLRDGAAYVSFVAFTLRGMRLNTNLPGIARLTAPIATHAFLNLRTYVTHRGEPGIYFLAEWLPNRVSLVLGPQTFGLPYRFGVARYRHETPGTIRGEVEGGADGRLVYAAAPTAAVGGVREPAPAEAGSLREFLLERYTAWTQWRGVRRRFRVWHEPWRAVSTAIEVSDESILRATGDWWAHATRIGADWSPGVRGVWMGRPTRMRDREENRVLAGTPRTRVVTGGAS